jgi:hypothetical protein
MQLVIILVIAGVIVGAAAEGARRARIGRAMERSFDAMRPPSTVGLPAHSAAGPRRASVPRPSIRWEPRSPHGVAKAS